MNKKEKVMLFRCKGPGVPNDLPKCTNTITTNINDKRIEKRGGYETKLYGQKRYFPTRRTYTCSSCLDYFKKWEEQVNKKLAIEFAKHFIK